MNFLAVFPEEYQQQKVVLRGERFQRVMRVHNCKLGTPYRLVMLEKGQGTAHVTRIGSEEVEFEIASSESIVLRPEVTLCVGICRPQTVKKILHAAVAFNVKRVLFLASANTEKSYFSSKVFASLDCQNEILVAASEQSGCPYWPRVETAHYFSKGLHEVLPDILRTTAHSYIGVVDSVSVGNFALSKESSVSICIGPEKGWTEKERNALCDLGFTPVSLHPFQLRTELAVVSFLALTL